MGQVKSGIAVDYLDLAPAKLFAGLCVVILSISSSRVQHDPDVYSALTGPQHRLKQ